MILASRGYNASTATSRDVDAKLAAGTFDLVILSVMLGEEEKQRVRGILPSGTKVLSLTALVHPDELFDMITSAVGGRIAAPPSTPLQRSRNRANLFE
jgi:DNA-binding response OmpR family regulator